MSPETDLERQERLGIEQMQRDRALQQYKKLKAKFEGEGSV
jgi:hypothetical protein